MSADKLLAAAASVDVIETAGRIIGNPRRNAMAASTAEVLALAHATERFWEVALEASVLVRTLELAMPWDSTDGEQAERVALQAAHVRDLMAAITEQKSSEREKSDAGS